MKCAEKGRSGGSRLAIHRLRSSSTFFLRDEMRHRSDRPNLVVGEVEKGREGKEGAGAAGGGWNWPGHHHRSIASSHLRNSSDLPGRMDGRSVAVGRSRRNEDWIRKSNLHARS